MHESGFTIALTEGAEVVVHAPNGRNVSAETGDAPVVTWQTDAWCETDGAAMPLPSWDGEALDYEAAVEALWPAADSGTSSTPPAASARFP